MRSVLPARLSDALKTGLTRFARLSFAHWRGSVALVGFATIGLASACNDATDEQELESAVATHCTFNSDCASPNICVFGLCHAECETSTDCTSPERCVLGSDGQSNVCQLPAETACQTSASCPGTQVCGVDGNCRDGCTSEADCVSGQVCTQGTCADKTEVAKLGGKLPEATGHTGSGQACTYNSDCKTGLACIDHQCLVQCMVDADCAEGLSCQSNLCVAPECDHDSDCGFGNVCEKNACVAGCRNDAGCDSGSICNSEVCSPGCRNDLGCAAGSLCVSGTCTAACTSDSDCDSGSICDSSACKTGCRTDASCAAGMRCFALECESPLFSANNPANGIAATDEHLFVLYGDALIQCPLTGCTSATADNVTNFEYPSESDSEALTEQSPGHLSAAVRSSLKPAADGLNAGWSSRSLAAFAPRPAVRTTPIKGLLTYSQASDQVMPLVSEGAYVLVGTQYPEFGEDPQQEVEEGCVVTNGTCAPLEIVPPGGIGLSTNFYALSGTPIAAALRTVSPLSADTSIVYAVVSQDSTPVMTNWILDNTNTDTNPNGSNFDLDPETSPDSMTVVPGAQIADDVVVLGFADGSINAYLPSACTDFSCAIPILGASPDGFEAMSLVWSASDSRLYWVTQTSNQTLMQFSTTTNVMRCTPNFAKANSCVAETVLTATSVNLKGFPDTPFDSILAIGNGALLLADDGNVWSAPLPK